MAPRTTTSSQQPAVASCQLAQDATLNPHALCAASSPLGHDPNLENCNVWEISDDDDDDDDVCLEGVN
ncbi:hypothetical protein AWZ03_001080 [Drosophila navojoa]|uniref:Uncharacterized protein n=1 Tax=Drosophila navojoa TaxID=7232 RepID=A0A484BVJ3_DRONA|nr:hypothetical protein AWZ03_001080 [Drosophila navojoa]